MMFGRAQANRQVRRLILFSNQQLPIDILSIAHLRPTANHNSAPHVPHARTYFQQFLLAEECSMVYNSTHSGETKRGRKFYADA